MKTHASLLCLVLTALVQAGPAPNAARQRQGKFIKTEVNKDKKIVALKTAIVSYRKGDVSVDLVAAVHIGDRSYYRDLNRQFTQYDALLYEMVGPQNARPDRGQLDLLGLASRFFLDLESQKERINYGKANFVHADLDFGGMKAEMQKRGEDGLILGLRIAADLLQQKNLAQDNPAAEELLGLATADSPLALKSVLAGQLEKIGGLGMPALEQVLVKDRNRFAVQVLEREIKNGKKKLAFFYGAAHCPDLEDRLRALGFARHGESWLTAWDLNEDD